AEGGTLFLDEIANLPLPQQAKLLPVLEAGEYERVGASRPRGADVRVVAATNADIHAEVKAGRFREDLLFRLNTVEIRLPPLRERRADIPLLAAHFLHRYAARYGKAAMEFTPDAMEVLLRHSWPGNVRELDHAIERAMLMAEGGRVQARDFGLDGGGGGGAAIVKGHVVRPLQTVSNVLAALRERDYTLRARGSNPEDALGLLLLELNSLGDDLRAQRLGALEATALLRRVMEEIDVAIFAF